jgi:hypothetical protein
MKRGAKRGVLYEYISMCEENYPLAQESQGNRDLCMGMLD